MMANRDGDIATRWSWVERDVWTDRMLTALEQGVKGGVWYSLIDKVASLRTLRRAFQRVKRNKGAAGVDHVTVGKYEERLEKHLESLRDDLLDGTYHPSALRRKWIDKPGKRDEKRPLGIPTVRDRVVQTALKMVMEPIFELTFHPESYGFRPQRKAQQALARVMEHLNAKRQFVVDVDFRKFFDSIPQDRLLSLVAERISDSRILDLLKRFLEAGILDGEKFELTTSGTPQGGVISPLLANIYLNGLDHSLADAGFEMVRYADDFVILCESAESAQAALQQARQWAEATELQVHPEKTRVVDMREPRAHFDFLGFRFLCHRKKHSGEKRLYRFVRPASLRKVKDRLRRCTRRNSGHSWDRIIQTLNRTLRGWFGYFRTAHVSQHCRLDQWLRRRLRSLLRRRHKRKGISRGADHQRWPISFFHEAGLFSLEAAHLNHVSPLRR